MWMLPITGERPNAAHAHARARVHTHMDKKNDWEVCRHWWTQMPQRRARRPQDYITYEYISIDAHAPSSVAEETTSTALKGVQGQGREGKNA